MLTRYLLVGIGAVILWAMLVTAVLGAVGAPLWANFIAGMLGGFVITLLTITIYVDRHCS